MTKTEKLVKVNAVIHKKVNQITTLKKEIQVLIKWQMKLMPKKKEIHSLTNYIIKKDESK